jgi:glycine/D-amino acid oxidase-like deaminating enzyme
MKYDIIIVGSGISGLYSAYKIRKMYPELSVLILEKYGSKWIGGRTNNESFYGTQIVSGAGIGRVKKDHLLFKLLNELDIEYKPFTVQKAYASSVERIDIMKTVRFLRTQYENYEKPPKTTFKDFATKHLGKATYQHFVVNTGYTDYENEDVYDTLYHYGFDDLIAGWTGAQIPWHELVERLLENIGSKREHVHTTEKVVGIDGVLGDFSIMTEKGHTYNCRKVIVATTITSVKELFPGMAIYNQIHGQPFLRMYGKFSGKSAEIMRERVTVQTIVTGALYKIIPMDTEKGIYMIGYTDNAGALELRRYLENTTENREKWAREIEKALNIEDGSLGLTAIRDYYWPIGTHYYEPLDRRQFENRESFIQKAQNPMDGILVVGEMVSLNQGWVQGALESVESVLHKKWILL